MVCYLHHNQCAHCQYYSVRLSGTDTFSTQYPLITSLLIALKSNLQLISYIYIDLILAKSVQ